MSDSAYRRPRRGDRFSRPLLDRLVERDDDAPNDGPMTLTQVEEAVVRDLQRLLNTRAAWPAAANHAELVPSALDYGLRDYAGMEIGGPRTGPAPVLASEIERVIRAYEPRLRGVVVRPIDPSESSAESTPRKPTDGPNLLRFRVEGDLVAVAGRRRMRWEASLDTARRIVTVEQP